MKPVVLLSYDVEEFDMPMEYGGSISLEEQLLITTNGLNKLLHLLNKYGILCTFYCTAQYALHRRQLIQGLHKRGFEIASHGYYHSKFEVAHLKSSKDVLEEIIQHPVKGYRMARMMPLPAKAVADAGYIYNSSINPTWIPGRYNHFSAPRTPFMEEGILQFPASVTPRLRIPLFWLGFHNYPLPFYLRCSNVVLKKDGYLNIYFHPWEFEVYKGVGGANFPAYVVKNSGDAMLQRTEQLIKWAIKKGYDFGTTGSWLATHHHTQ